MGQTGAVQTLVFIGIPGAGKSTFHRSRFFDTHLRNYLDQLRNRRREATKRWDGASQLKKREFLLEYEIDFAALPLWQTRGYAGWWQSYEKEAVDRKTGQTVLAVRKRLVLEHELPFGDEFAGWLRGRI